MTQAQDKALKALRGESRRLRKRLRVFHERTDYEDLGHGVLALEIADHAVNEALERTGRSGEIRKVPNRTAHRHALRWHKAVKDVRAQGATNPCERGSGDGTQGLGDRSRLIRRGGRTL